MKQFTLNDMLSLAIKHDYINNSFSRSIAIFHHKENRKIMTCEQMAQGIHIRIVEQSTGHIIREDHAHTAGNAILLMEA